MNRNNDREIIGLKNGSCELTFKLSKNLKKLVPWFVDLLGCSLMQKLKEDELNLKETVQEQQRGDC